MAIAKLCAFKDSGAPEGSTDYTTVVVLHGFVWHGATFEKMLPFAKQHNTRLIIVNRHDYPGGPSYSDEERALLQGCAVPPANPEEAVARRDKLMEFMNDRGHEVYEYLQALVENDHLPLPQAGRNAGGIVVGGWSFGTVWMLALLNYVQRAPQGGIDLSAYVRRVVLYDPGFRLLGYPTDGLRDPYSPLHDPTIAPEDLDRTGNAWVSGYFAHGATADTLERRTPLSDPSPVSARLTPEELAGLRHLPAALPPTGTDALLYFGGDALGLYAALRKAALFSDGERAGGEGAVGEKWRDMEVLVLWGTRSVWDIPHAVMCLRSELDTVKTEGAPARNVRIEAIEGGNHFTHWDMPEFCLRAFIQD